MYRDTIIELYKNPFNKGVLVDADITHSGANVTCGDRVRIYLKLTADQSIVHEARFEGEGCAISIAAASLITDYIKNKPVAKIAQCGVREINSLLRVELSPSRIKCGLLALETIQMGLNRGGASLTSKNR